MTDRPQQPTTHTSFAQVLSESLAAHDFTLDQLSRELGRLGTPLSTATLSYWCTGRSVPARPKSKLAVAHLERLLDLPPGRLVSALPSELNARWSPTVGVDDLGPAQRVAAGWGLDLGRHVAVKVTTDHALVSADRRRLREESLQLQRGEDAVVERMPIGLRRPAPGAEPVEIMADHGCRVGRTTLLADLLMVEILLDVPLLRADLRQIRYGVDWRSETPISSHVRRVPLVMNQLALAVTFEGTPPRTAQYRLTQARGAEPTIVDLQPGAHLQRVMINAPVGVHQLTWQDS
ncbi:hypothetical protein AAEX63_07035 [Luteococcus sp. H138]|uniref:hypothetical protein n=1 Tax=unclassified Luteococcus TaxID=2639923 RepID=UPI00313C702E